MKEFFTYAGIVLVGLFALFAGFKCSQAAGRMRRNDLYTYWGEGSFLSFLITPLVIAFWGLLAGVCFVVTISLISNSLNDFDTGSADQQKTVSTPLRMGTQSSVHIQPKIEDSAQTRHTESRPIERKEPAIETEGAKQWTAEEIRQMEIEKQYAGNDPIVRMRLGLPPKIDQ